MHSSRDDRDVLAKGVIASGESLSIELIDGRNFQVPFSGIASLARATPEQRGTFQLLGAGSGVYWPDLDEDLSVSGLFRDFGEGKPHLLHEIPHLIADLYRVTKRLGEIFDGRPFTPDGHLVGSIGEVVAELVYDLDLLPPSTPHYDARTRDGQRTVQIKLTGPRGTQYGFRWRNQQGQQAADLLICLRMTEQGFQEIYAGAFPTDLLEKRPDSSNGQLSIPVSKLLSRNPASLPQVYSLAYLNKLFRSDLEQDPSSLSSGAAGKLVQHDEQVHI